MIKKIIKIVALILISFSGISQTRPTGNPSVLSTNGWYKIAWIESDSGLIARPRDTASFSPRFTGTIVMQPNIRKFYYYDSTDLRWYPLSSTANNGLTLTGNNIQLGGTLVQSTDINNGGFLFYLHGTGQNLLRTQSGTYQGNIATSGVGAAITFSNSATNLFSEVNAVEGNAYLVGGKNGVFYNEVHADSNRVYLVTKSNTAPKKVILDTLGYVTFDAYPFLTQETDTTINKPVGMNSSGKLVPMAYWRSSGGGGSGLTSVGLSMPSAFSVTGSPLTSNGTISVFGAGTTSQYIRGNGTLATTDTSMIPNFYLKVRGLISGTSPITFNQTTGLIGINNANTTGTKGAATFSNSDFSDNGSGLISLINMVSPGSCTNCNLTYDVKGRIMIAASGSGGGGSSVDTIYRTPGVDSIYFTINGGAQRAIKDSTGSSGGGTVTSVSGTTNRITVTNPTTTPVVDISIAYVGQPTITTLGTITTGTWNGTVIGPTFGGTGQTTVTTGDLLYGSASNVWSKLADVATGNALISGGVTTAPSWGKIGLTTHVSGILPIANGGTGTATPSLVAGTNIFITGSWPNQTINASGSAGGGLDWKQSATALTGSDTAKLWIKTPSKAAIYDVLTYVRGSWERFGWLDSVDNVFSTRRPMTILICGQSNAAGVGPGGDTAYTKGMIAYSTGSVGGVSNEYQTLWVPARIGISPFYSNNNNIAFQVGKQLIKHNDADIVRVISTYEGGTSLASWIGSGGNLFLLDTLRSRLRRSGIDTIDIFCWHQGESGGITGFTFGGYVVDQRVLYDTLCSTLTVGFKRNYTKYIAGGLGNATDSATIYNVGSPEGGQRTLNWDGNLNTAWVPSWGLSDIGDGVHFTGTSLDTLGYRYYSEALRLVHTPYEEYPEYNYDTTFDKYVVYADRLLPYAGGGSSFKRIDGISIAYDKGVNPLLTIDGTTTSGTIRLGASNGYTDAVPKMFQVNGKALISDGGFNLIIGGNWNITGDPAHNVVLANYSSSFTGAAGGDDNIMIGYNAGYNGTRSLFNSTIIGSGAANGISPLGFGDNIVAIGKDALSSGACLNCAFVGNSAGASAQGNALTGLGTSAGALNSTGRVNSTAIGANTKYNEDSVFVAGNALKRFIIGGTTSLPFLVGAPSNGQYFAWNTSNSQFQLTNAPSGGITTLNTLTATTQTFATGTSGSDFNISSATSTHTFNIPDAGTGARGLVTTGTQTFGGLKTFNGGATILAPFTLTLGSDATGDIYYRTGGAVVRRAIGSTNDVLTVSGGVPIWQAPGYSYGTYTPTLTNVTNISASTAYQCQYMRVGNVVTVSGKVDIDPGAVGLATLGISIPIASALANDFECGGTAGAGTVLGLNGAISADPANDRVELDFTIPVAGIITNTSWFFTFTYYIDVS